MRSSLLILFLSTVLAYAQALPPVLRNVLTTNSPVLAPFIVLPGATTNGMPNARVFTLNPGAFVLHTNGSNVTLYIKDGVLLTNATVTGLRLPDFNVASNKLWTATNATTGEGEWRFLSFTNSQ